MANQLFAISNLLRHQEFRSIPRYSVDVESILLAKSEDEANPHVRGEYGFYAEEEGKDDKIARLAPQPTRTAKLWRKNIHGKILVPEYYTLRGMVAEIVNFVGKSCDRHFGITSNFEGLKFVMYRNFGPPQHQAAEMRPGISRYEKDAKIVLKLVPTRSKSIINLEMSMHLFQTFKFTSTNPHVKQKNFFRDLSKALEEKHGPREMDQT